MVNVYDSANQLAEDLKKTPEYTALKEAVQSVKNDENSSNLFQKMDEVQTKIMAAQQSGQPLTDDEKAGIETMFAINYPEFIEQRDKYNALSEQIKELSEKRYDVGENLKTLMMNIDINDSCRGISQDRLSDVNRYLKDKLSYELNMICDDKAYTNMQMGLQHLNSYIDDVLEKL